MIATIINALAVVLGGILGLVGGKALEKNNQIQSIVFVSIGIITLVVGMMMALRTERILYLALSLVLGGIVGEILGIERRIQWLGEKLHKITSKKAPQNPEGSPHLQDQAGRFAAGFLEASVLFCVGSMAILGSIQAGIQGQYSILLTKSVMDGFMAILLTASLGIGVIYSSVSIFAYQGLLTILAAYLGAQVSPLLLSEISGIGGAMILMIGLNLLQLKKIPTANFLPGLVIVVVLTVLDPVIPQFFK
jgi:uncharacterized membrane protein YqgA involved in biofilm formation